MASNDLTPAQINILADEPYLKQVEDSGQELSVELFFEGLECKARLKAGKMNIVLSRKGAEQLSLVLYEASRIAERKMHWAKVRGLSPAPTASAQADLFG